MAINLPPIEIQATPKKWTGKEICAVYENAIELTTNKSFMRGILTAYTLASSVVLGFGFYALARSSIRDHTNPLLSVNIDIAFDVFIVVAALAVISLHTFFLRYELFTHLKDATLYNRKNQTVSIFKVRYIWWKPFSSWPLQIETYPWNQVRARIEGGVSGNINVPQYRCTLWLDILDKPDGSKVINKFPVGFASGFSEDRIALWEHVRRYMNGYGPAMNVECKLWREDLSSPKQAFMDNFLPSHDPTRKTLNIIFFPLMLPIALCAALAVWTSKKSAWPQEILDAAGEGPLNDEQIQALIQAEKHLVPPKVVEQETKPLFARLD